MRKRITGLFLAVMMLCTVMPFMAITASADDSSDKEGICGDSNGKISDNLRYTVSEDGKTLTITGSGKMHNFGFWSYDFVPWWDYHNTIENIVIGSGVESIGENAFREFNKITHLYVPGNVKSIGRCAVYYCEKLNSVCLDEGVETIANEAFRYNYDLRGLWLPLSLQKVGYRAFADCYINWVYSAREDDDYERPFKSFWFETDGTAFADNGYYTYMFFPFEIMHLPKFNNFSGEWSVDETHHWKTDKIYMETHYEYGEHSFNKEYKYEWDGDVCTVKKVCTVCGMEVELETKKGIYVDDIDHLLNGKKGHYEVTFDNSEYGTRCTESCSVVIERGGHTLFYPEEGYYEIHAAVNENLCMNIVGGAAAKDAGANLLLDEENRSEAKLFKLEWDRAFDAYMIRAVHSGMILDVDGSDSAQGANIRQWTDERDGDQRWVFMDDRGDGRLYIRNLRGGWMDIAGGSVFSNTNIHSWGFTGADNQKWTLRKVDYAEPTPTPAPEPAPTPTPAPGSDGVSYTLDGGVLTVSGSGDIGDYAFAQWFDIRSVVIEDGVTGIGAGAFAGTEVSSVQIPGSVQSIGGNAFDFCYNLSSVSFADGALNSIGDRAFFMCGKLSEITIPASVQSIGNEVFAKSGISKIVFLGDCSIGEYAFNECYLTISVPAGWTHGTEEWYGGYDVVYEGSGVASVLSQGSVWIVCAVAAAAVVAVGAIVIVKKKRVRSEE